MKEDKMSWEQILHDINNTPLKQLSDDEQEWLGIFHSSQVLENALNNHADRYSKKKKAVMKRFIQDVKEMFEKFDAFYGAYLRRD